jgi:hypothetical protein
MGSSLLQWKSPGLLARAFFDSVLSVTDWGKLIGNLDVVCLHRVRWFLDLTGILVGFSLEFERSEENSNSVGVGGWKAPGGCDRSRSSGSFAPLRMTT